MRTKDPSYDYLIPEFISQLSPPGLPCMESQLREMPFLIKEFIYECQLPTEGWCFSGASLGTDQFLIQSSGGFPGARRPLPTPTLSPQSEQQWTLLLSVRTKWSTEGISLRDASFLSLTLFLPSALIWHP